MKDLTAVRKIPCRVLVHLAFFALVSAALSQTAAVSGGVTGRVQNVANGQFLRNGASETRLTAEVFMKPRCTRWVGNWKVAITTGPVFSDLRLRRAQRWE